METVTLNNIDYPILGTYAGAVEYLAASLQADAFNNGTVEFKQRAMIATTRMFARLNWKGVPSAGVAPPMVWPRDNTGVSPNGTTPEAVIFGFYEMVALVAEDPDVLSQSSSGSNVQRAKGGDAEVWFFRSTLETATALPFSVHGWVKPFLTGSGDVGAESFGVDCDFKSVFDQVPERSRGLN